MTESPTTTDARPTQIVAGEQYVFTARHHQGDHPIVTAVRPLTTDEADLADVGPMWVVEFPGVNGAADAMGDVFADELTPAPSDVEHMFQPFVCVLRRPDGRYTIDLDWSDAYLGENTEDGWDDRGNGQPAQDAVDAWRKTQPATYVIPAADATPADADDDERSFLDIADDEGWTDATILDVVLDFIGGRFLDPELIAYAKTRAASTD